MKFLLKANMYIDPIGPRHIIPISFFMVDGGPKRGFKNGEEMSNDLILTDEFRDAKEYKNIVVGRHRDIHSGFLSWLLELGNGFHSIFEVESYSEDNSIRKFLSLHMFQTCVSSLGITPAGNSGIMEKFKFTFSVGDISFGSCITTK